MKILGAHDAVQAAPPNPNAGDVPTPAHQALWFELAKRRLVSVVLVPTCAGSGVGRLAETLALVGRRMGDSPITAVVAETVDYAFVARTTEVLAVTGRGGEKRPGASPLEVVIGITPVTVDPLGLAVVHAVDGVVLCVDLGRSRKADLREAVALMGRDRIVGAVTIG